MNLQRRTLVVGILLALAAFGLPSFAAQKSSGGAKPQAAQADEVQAGAFGDFVSVAVVNVDVYVTDKKGNRVSNLEKDDFEILENGRPVAVTNFFAVDEGKPRLEPGDEPAPSTPASATPALPDRSKPATEPDLPEDQRLHLVVYIDNFNLQPFSRNRVLRELRDFLRNKLRPGDRTMLVTYDRELHVRHPWTGDPTVIAASLQELETMTGSALHRESDRRDILDRIEEAETVQAALSTVRVYAENLNNDLTFTIDALRDFVNNLAGLPGRKAILYVSEGLPMIVGEDLFHAVQQKFQDQSTISEAFQFDASRRFKELSANANANRVTFYTIDAGGLRTYGYGDASRQTAGQGAFVEQIYIQNLQGPLQLLADDTGGKAIINANRISDALDQVARDFGTYYSLGYMPAHQGDGRYYKIEVRLKKGKDYRIRHREGYRDKPVSVRMSDGTMAALTQRFETNPLGIKLDFGDETPGERGQFLVPVKVSIPLGKLVLIPADDLHHAKLRLFVAALDNEGGMSDVQEVPVPIDIPAADVERAKGQFYLYSVNLVMRKGPHRVAVGLRDDVGGESSFITGVVQVGR